MDDPVDLKVIDAVVTPLVRAAGEIALGRFRSKLVPEDKGRAGAFDPVTEADRMTEDYLRSELSILFPQSEVVGEEGGTTGPVGRTRWLIDPIDGTKAYVTGVPAWGVLLGLMVDGRAVAGWCRQPYLDETFAGITGTGWLEHDATRRPLASSSTTDLAVASMYSTHPSMFATSSERDAFETLAGRVRLQRYGGDCYSYCLLALGLIDLVVESNLQPHDIVALIPIVEAAGGVITGPDGRSPVGGGFVIAAATAALHAQALELIRPRLAPTPGGSAP